MTCQEFIETLGRYLSNEVTVTEKGQADLHLKVCPHCVSYLKSYEVTIRLGKRAMEGDSEEPVPEDLVEIILSARPKT